MSDELEAQPASANAAIAVTNEFLTKFPLNRSYNFGCCNFFGNKFSRRYPLPHQQKRRFTSLLDKIDLPPSRLDIPDRVRENLSFRSRKMSSAAATNFWTKASVVVVAWKVADRTLVCPKVVVCIMLWNSPDPPSSKRNQSARARAGATGSS
jgi:hypothetical protein